MSVWVLLLVLVGGLAYTAFLLLGGPLVVWVFAHRLRYRSGQLLASVRVGGWELSLGWYDTAEDAERVIRRAVKLANRTVSHLTTDIEGRMYQVQ